MADAKALKEELFSLLKSKGAALVGAGSLEGITLNEGMFPDDNARLLRQAFEEKKLKIGVSVAVPVPASIVKDLKTAPTKEYRDAYFALNHELDEIVKAGENFLCTKGFLAFANSTDRVHKNEDNRTPLPHKTVATRAGIGWIGKNCLLVTPQYGCAVRISSLLTNAPLPLNEPIETSRCGSCRRCVEACPAGALKGTLWKEGVERAAIFDWPKCRQKQLERMIAATGIHQALCGLCFAVCPFTQKYLQQNRK
ncbi:MAG: 4Fe-4S binding protein [Acidaminococcus sp.]|jgi:epoxyqueuosine reductase QueG|nr:4Fe-4S binding protein [Acidaminococcus sp.]MCI2099387.1 4Fe-4S binding protein [Acidaminococcus sp.]MCI2113747.1 4Fe-4S binding protein [Acidaminococcus sp.]MCI2115679.1 4Fe-4S binding protein [Acidaminococcus sp.]